LPAEEREGKLHFKGTVATETEKNEIWTAIKTIPTWQNDIVADIRVTGGPAAGAGAPTAAAAPSAGKTYTVKASDALGGIAKEHLGSARGPCGSTNDVTITPRTRSASVEQPRLSGNKHIYKERRTSAMWWTL
jgi:hypothetical protein